MLHLGRRRRQRFPVHHHHRARRRSHEPFGRLHHQQRHGSIAGAADSAKSFRLPPNLLSLGQVSVTGTRTASAPSDTNAANDSVSVILATCP
ncbi:hypothetical protein AB0I49_16250 [Streptomyces sp. NPDC050617]|uniref:hypothetical protein n=1 Tax=Streptomyces sp. NPDC050617 TaxID=3154628 RepID=UPI00342E84C2